MDNKIYVTETNYWAVLLPNGKMLGCGALDGTSYDSKEEFCIFAKCLNYTEIHTPEMDKHASL